MLEQADESRFYAQTVLPTEHGDFDVRVFVDDGKEHLAISCGELSGQVNVPVRVHSECLTGEVLGSLKCDCKPQLHSALRYIAAAGQGVVIYLRQEGRGIGLGNKIRAYRLQENGADTVDANRLLGFGDDLRTYSVAAEVLRALGIKSVALLTNNPLKIDGLRSEGIDVTKRISIVTGVNEINEEYLQTKRLRMGHMLGADLEKEPEHVVEAG